MRAPTIRLMPDRKAPASPRYATDTNDGVQPAGLVVQACARLTGRHAPLASGAALSARKDSTASAECTVGPDRAQRETATSAPAAPEVPRALLSRSAPSQPAPAPTCVLSAQRALSHVPAATPALMQPRAAAERGAAMDSYAAAEIRSTQVTAISAAERRRQWLRECPKCAQPSHATVCVCLRSSAPQRAAAWLCATVQHSLCVSCGTRFESVCARCGQMVDCRDPLHSVVRRSTKPHRTSVPAKQSSACAPNESA
jgi:hypothetical protein